MKGIIDRFEGDIAVIEIDGVTQSISKLIVCSSALPGDVVIWDDGLWTTDPKATEKRQRRIKQLMEDVWED